MGKNAGKNDTQNSQPTIQPEYKTIEVPKEVCVQTKYEVNDWSITFLFAFLALIIGLTLGLIIKFKK